VAFRGLSMRPTRSGIETLCPQDGVIPAGCFLGVMGPSGSGKCQFCVEHPGTFFVSDPHL
jgi:RecA/RadA recombinase